MSRMLNMFRKSRKVFYGRGLASTCTRLALIACLSLACLTSQANAAISTTGDVDPSDPATWDENTDAYIGKTSDGTMSITSGSEVESNYGYIGYSVNNGEVTVDGSGSTWTSYYLLVGSRRTGTLNITDGGAVISLYSYIGFGSSSTGEVTVDGVGSTWTNNSLKIGLSEGSSGSLNITNGGVVATTLDTVTSYCSGWAPTGTGTIYFDNGTLTTGWLICAYDDLTGTGTVNTNGLVSDIDLVFNNTHGLIQTIDFDDNPGQDITVNLNVNGAGSMGAGHSGNGTMSISDGKVIESTTGYLGYISGAMGEVTVDGTNSKWTISGDLNAGNNGDGELNITDGGEVSNHIGYIGRFANSTGEVTVNGVDSTWTNSGALYIGGSGMPGVDTFAGDGTLTITNGGEVSDTVGYIGYNAAYGKEATVSVTGTNSTWTNSGSLYVGYSGNASTATLNITSGGAVSNTDGYIGCSGSTSTYAVTVDGANSTWTNTGNLTIGGLYSSGTLTITDQGTVSIGDLDIKTNSTVTLNGGTLELTDDMNFYGWDGTFTFTSGEIKVSDGTITPQAATTLGANQTLTVTGSSSIWDDDYYMNVDNGKMDITNGGSVSSTYGYIGFNEGSTGVVTVDGDDGSGNASTWTNTGDLYVGYSGGKAVLGEHLEITEVTRGGVLNITDGGEVTNDDGYIGYSSVTFASPDYHLSAGKATIDGTDSTWTNSGNLYVGYGAAGLGPYIYGGEMVVSNGGLVESDRGYIGTLSGSMAVVTVTGTNSEWNNSGNLYVGGAGQGSLTIEAGGAVTSSTGYIGNSSGSTGEVVVTSSSTWTNTGNLSVGHTGQGSLTIEAGCSVSSSNLYIGYTSSSSNTVSVSGANAALTVSSGLYVGGGSSTAGNGMMSITGNGAVSNVNGNIGSYTGSTGTVVVNGSGTTWTNTGNLVVGDDGTGTLYIHGGGLVIVGGTLTIDDDNDNDSFVNMKTGAQLSLYGEGDDSLNDFLTLVSGDDNNVIRYWDGSAWDDLANATKVDPIDLDSYNEYSLVYDAGYTTLTVGVINNPLVPLMGDANRDGVVSAGDYASVQANFGHTSYPGDWDLYGDANWDGVVSAGDYASVQANFGNVASSDVPVPEPATMCLLGLGGLTMLLRKRK